MKFRTTLVFALSFGVVTSFAGLAFAQTGTPAASVTISTQTAIVTVAALIAGFIGQAVNTGSFLGIVTTPKAWIPYLTLVGSFLTAFGMSLQSAPSLSGTAILNAIIAGVMALSSTGAGAACHTHLNAHKSFQGKKPAPAAPAPAAPATDGGGK